MDIRKAECATAAGFLTVMVVGATIQPAEARHHRDLVVTANDPALVRRVSYSDLNLRMQPDQRQLYHRVDAAADNICTSVNFTSDSQEDCFTFATRGARPQIRRAIERAELIAEGRPVGPPIAISIKIIGN